MYLVCEKLPREFMSPTKAFSVPSRVSIIPKMEPIITICDNEEFFSPSTLHDICIRACVAYADVVLIETPITGKSIKLRKSADLPVKLWEDVLEQYDRKSMEYLNLIIAINEKIPSGLPKINLNGCTTMIDSDLAKVMQKYPQSLEIHNCPLLTKKVVDTINEFGKNLESLHIGNSSHILPTEIKAWLKSKSSKPKGYKAERQKIQRLAKSINHFFNKNDSKKVNEVDKGILQLPKLRKLIIWELQINQRQQFVAPGFLSKLDCGDNPEVTTLDYWQFLLQECICNLEYLDLSGCQELSNLNFLLQAKDTLKTLRLHDVLLDYDDRTWGVLRNLTNLKYLDVSQYNELASIFSNPDEVLENIVTSLVNLTALDISGTNLAGYPPEDIASSLPKCSIKGLESRVQNPFHFLGLMTTHHTASNRKHVPAIKIAGESTMEQIVIALQHYLPLGNMTRKTIRILQAKLYMTTQNDFVPRWTLLSLLHQVMKIHIDDKHILIVATAAIFYLVQNTLVGDPNSMSNIQMHGIVSSIIEILQTYPHDISLLRNAVLLLLYLSTKLNLKVATVMAEELAVTLLTMGVNITSNVCPEFHTFFTESIAHLMCSIVESGPSVQSLLRRSLKVMRGLCDLIGELMNHKFFATLPYLWMILYRITDSCNDPVCCELFLKTNGINVCFRFIKLCNDDDIREGQSKEKIEELLQTKIPVVALLTNLVSSPAAGISIIKEIHIYEAVRIFSSALPPGRDEKLLLHITCGFLANVATKKLSHSLLCPTRSQILTKISETMVNLDFINPLDFTFRNLTMIYDMLGAPDASAIHFWALKTLVQLMKAEPEKFCQMITNDKRLTSEKLDELCQKTDDELKTEFRNLCDFVITEINL